MLLTIELKENLQYSPPSSLWHFARGNKIAIVSDINYQVITMAAGTGITICSWLFIAILLKGKIH